MREKLIKVIEEMAAAENFDESKYNEFYELLNTLKGNRGLIGVAADEITEYYAWWRQNKKHIPRNDEEATEIRENLRLLAAGLQRNISNFRSFEHLRKELEGEDLRPK